MLATVHSIVAPDGPAEALALYRSGHLTADLLVTDVVMPGMSGRDLAEQLHLIVPTFRWSGALGA